MQQQFKHPAQENDNSTRGIAHFVPGDKDFLGCSSRVGSARILRLLSCVPFFPRQLHRSRDGLLLLEEQTCLVYLRKTI